MSVDASTAAEPAEPLFQPKTAWLSCVGGMSEGVPSEGSAFTKKMLVGYQVVPGA